MCPSPDPDPATVALQRLAAEGRAFAELTDEPAEPRCCWCHRRCRGAACLACALLAVAKGFPPARTVLARRRRAQ